MSRTLLTPSRQDALAAAEATVTSMEPTQLLSLSREEAAAFLQVVEDATITAVTYGLVVVRSQSYVHGSGLDTVSGTGH